MTYARDPMSPRYDQSAGRLLGRALAAPGKWVYVTVPRPRANSRIRAIMAEAGIELESRDRGGLTVWERAFLRSVYWTLGQDDEWSLQREWGPRSGRGRVLGVRASRKDVGRRAVKRKPPADRYTENPAIRSGGIGSGQERF